MDAPSPSAPPPPPPPPPATARGPPAPAPPGLERPADRRGGQRGRRHRPDRLARALPRRRCPRPAAARTTTTVAAAIDLVGDLVHQLGNQLVVVHRLVVQLGRPPGGGPVEPVHHLEPWQLTCAPAPARCTTPASARWAPKPTSSSSTAGPRLLSVARRRLGQLEACWSRFIPTSEISTCNRLAGTPVWVSADTALLIDTAIEGWHLSAGRFDPTVLGDVLRAGYDLSFDELDGRPEWLRPAPPMLRRGCGEIAIERQSRRDRRRDHARRHRVRPRRRREGPGRRPGRRRAHGRRRRRSLRQPGRRPRRARRRPARRRLDHHRRGPVGRRPARHRRGPRVRAPSPPRRPPGDAGWPTACRSTT